MKGPFLWHQPRGACADEDDVIWMSSSHAGASPTGCRLNIRVLDAIPQQHCASFQGLAALQRRRGEWGSAIGLRIRGVEDARCTLRAVHGWTEDQIELVDQSRAQKGAMMAARN